MPSSASDSPNRAPIRSSRETSSQLVARLTAAAETNMTASGASDTAAHSRQQPDGGWLWGLGVRIVRMVWVPGSVL
jgi:hypothetical protein